MNDSLKSEIKKLKKERGTILYRENDPGSHLYILTAGKVCLFTEVKKNDFSLVNILGAGEFLGHEVLFKEGGKSTSYKYCAIVLEDVEYMRVEMKDIYSVTNELPQWILSLMKTLGDRHEEAFDVLKEHKLLSKFAREGESFSDSDLSDLVSSLRA